MTVYEKAFGMARTPFVRNIPTDQLYESPSMKEALGRLDYAADRQLFVVLTSDAGCGKSTLIRKFNDRLPKDKYLLLYVSGSKLTPKWLYKNLLDQLGLEAGFYRGEAKKLLQKQVEIIRTKEHRKVICVLDEAHLLEKETLEEFRFLLNSNFDSESQMALILVGQNELWDTKLRFKHYAAIRQRIDITCVLSHLDLSQTEKYIESNLRYAGIENALFTDKAVEEIYKGSTGIPRMINRICEKTLIYASQQNQKLIDEHMVLHVSQHEMLNIGDKHEEIQIG